MLTLDVSIHLVPVQAANLTLVTEGRYNCSLATPHKLRKTAGGFHINYYFSRDAYWNTISDTFLHGMGQSQQTRLAHSINCANKQYMHMYIAPICRLECWCGSAMSSQSEQKFGICLGPSTGLQTVAAAATRALLV